MKTVVQSQTGVGSTNPIVTNLNTTPVNIGFGVVVTGTVNYTVQHSYDGPFSSTGLVTWFPSSLAAQTANGSGSYLSPVTAVQLVVNSGTGTAVLSLSQAGIE